MPSQKKQERLEVRIEADYKRLIEHAATLCGQSLSSFVITQLLEVTRRIIDSERNRILSDRDRDRFLELLQTTEPNAKLKQAAKRYTKKYQTA